MALPTRSCCAVVAAVGGFGMMMIHSSASLAPRSTKSKSAPNSQSPFMFPQSTALSESGSSLGQKLSVDIHAICMLLRIEKACVTCNLVSTKMKYGFLGLVLQQPPSSPCALMLNESNRHCYLRYRKHGPRLILILSIVRVLITTNNSLDPFYRVSIYNNSYIV